MFTTLESLQGCSIKKALGLSKMSHHSKILQALFISKIKPTVQQMAASLWHSIFNVESPLRRLCIFLTSRYILSGELSAGTLTARLVNMGLSPIQTMVNLNRQNDTEVAEDGVINTLRALILSPDFRNRSSASNIMTSLLTRF